MNLLQTIVEHAQKPIEIRGVHWYIQPVNTLLCKQADPKVQTVLAILPADAADRREEEAIESIKDKTEREQTMLRARWERLQRRAPQMQEASDQAARALVCAGVVACEVNGQKQAVTLVPTEAMEDTNNGRRRRSDGRSHRELSIHMSF
jgi:hypothetical protein